MSLKKFYGANAREAMTEARRALGEDAVVISTRKTERGVEVVAASQGALAMLAERDLGSLNEPSPAPAAPAPSIAPMPSPISAPTAANPVRTPASRKGFAERAAAQRPIRHESVARDEVVPFLQFVQERPTSHAPTGVSLGASVASAAVPPARPQPARAPTFAQATATAIEPEVHLGQTPAPEIEGLMAELRNEFSQIRDWMTGQFDSMAFSDTSRRRPLAAAVQKDLLQAGFSPRLARDLSAKLPEGLDAHQARGWAAAVLEKNLACARAEEDLIDAGGIYALVGPTGVGKTTSVAKLASRCAMKYGRESVGLVTIDSYRIGAQDQLRIYGKILGISVHTAQDRETLLSVLRSLTGKRLVLIDTVGLGQRDERVAELLATVGSAPIKRLLVVNAAAQAETLEDVVLGYRGAHGAAFAGAILSKTDEAVQLGSALDVLIRNRLALYYETNGQRVPEDITFANAKSLILRAVTHLPARAFQVPEDEVGMTFLARQMNAGGAGAAHA